MNILAVSLIALFTNCAPNAIDITECNAVQFHESISEARLQQTAHSFIVVLDNNTPIYYARSVSNDNEKDHFKEVLKKESQYNQESQSKEVSHAK